MGSNLGDKARNLQEAIRLIAERVGTVVRQSSFIETEPWGFESDNTFVNAVICCETEKTPREVLDGIRDRVLAEGIPCTASY